METLFSIHKQHYKKLCRSCSSLRLYDYEQNTSGNTETIKSNDFLEEGDLVSLPRTH
jgi:hypothetical protein